MNYCGKQANNPIVDKIDLRPGLKCPFDAGAEPPQINQNRWLKGRVNRVKKRIVNN
jgi:hypothetical protein